MKGSNLLLQRDCHRQSLLQSVCWLSDLKDEGNLAKAKLLCFLTEDKTVHICIEDTFLCKERLS